MFLSVINGTNAVENDYDKLLSIVSNNLNCDSEIVDSIALYDKSRILVVSDVNWELLFLNLKEDEGIIELAELDIDIFESFASKLGWTVTTGFMVYNRYNPKTKRIEQYRE
jgi:hypothetical protein